MTELNLYQNNIPAKLEDLAKFVLIGRDKLDIVRSQIRAMDKLELAEGVRSQKKEEAQMLAEALLDAEVRIGEILNAMPKAQGQRSDLLLDNGVHKLPKLEAAKELGFDAKQVQRFQTLAANKDLVEQIKNEAREADDLPTRTAVLQAAKARNFIQQREEKIETAVKTTPVPSEEFAMIEALKRGETVVLNMNQHYHVIRYAKDNGLYQQIDRFSEWGNPFFLGPDGDRDEVCDGYEAYLRYKKSLHAKLSSLKGKALACHCAPLRCHGDHLKNLADGNN